MRGQPEGQPGQAGQTASSHLLRVVPAAHVRRPVHGQQVVHPQRRQARERACPGRSLQGE